MKTKRTELTETLPRREVGLFDEMERVFDTMMPRAWLHPFRELWPEWARLEPAFDMIPRVDLINREAEILVRAEVPGVDKKDLEVDLAGQLLTLRGERRLEETEEKGAFFRAEIARGGFSRTIRLPEEVDFTEAKAEFKDGVLEIHLPKTHKTEHRRIEVQ